MHEILIEKGAEKDIKRLPPDILPRIIVSIRQLAAHPRPAGCKKIAGSKSDWRIRIGDYRVVYEIDDRNQRIKVFRVKHRKDSYR